MVFRSQYQKYSWFICLVVSLNQDRHLCTDKNAQSIIIISRIYDYFVREALEGGPAGAFLLGGLEAADDVLECGRHHKVLLLQTKFFPLKEL